ncbi:ATP-dependent protease La (LON) substrate-binding domain-containing protein [Geodermatophilus saharensis]|uniref:ATP-dependent protease La (LON) substrate-binding domain-containing protein n=1 Tax=Geodermatophilus saharensis TaxID=1137994 RepID=A0A239E2B5_9ACTN|nr:LON peptidase substrate-binding domain-containing protein [Geodermatophilus saharensis]SNS38418.1 ATP-dependent protease La (LON) substrate-binding domain-containing protein [Geodermatophilus saharensis]
MSGNERLPLLPLDDTVVLPGMAVPVELDGAEARVAVEAAGAQEGTGRVLLVPRLHGRYAGVGTVAVVEQVGRLPGGQPGALVRGTARARVGAGATGPGGALWVEVTVLADEAVDEGARELAREYRGLVVSVLQARGAWQLIDGVQRVTDPSAVADTAGYASHLTAEQELTLLETPDVAARLRLAIGWAREHLAELEVAETIRKDVQEGMDRQQREFLLRRQLAA